MLNTLRNRIGSSKKTTQGVTLLIFWVAKVFRINLLLESYHRNGILNYKTDYESGEEYFIKNWLPNWLSQNHILEPVVFDVGANLGNYSNSVVVNIPKVRLHSFEPHPQTCAKLQQRLRENQNAIINQIAVGSAQGKITLHGSIDSENSEHCSLYESVLTEQHVYTDTTSIEVAVTTVESYLKSQNITEIHFLKIDTEGHEYDVLLGAGDLLQSGRIHIIQFEFNEMNIISRHFLKDFVGLLNKYVLYRLHSNKLVPICYSSFEEIFLFQNIVAILK